MINNDYIKVSTFTHEFKSNNTLALFDSLDITHNFNFKINDNIVCLKRTVVHAKYYVKLHIRSRIRYKYIQRYFKITILILHAIANSITFSSLEKSIFNENQLYIFMILIILLNILSTILISIADFCKFKEKMENHRCISNEWIKFIKKIVIEIETSSILTNTKLKEINTDYDHIVEHSPHIPNIIIYDFLKTTKKSYFYEYILFPLGCIKKPNNIDYSII